MHTHYPIEIYISLDGDFKMDFGAGFHRYSCVIIDSNVPHRFEGPNGSYGLILINPRHHRADNLVKHVLRGGRYREFDASLCRELIAELLQSRGNAISYHACKKSVDRFLCILTEDMPSETSMDLRIEVIMALIRGSIKDTQRVACLARSVHLSESRLRHLFKEETGLTIRRYVLHLRLTEALRLIIDGSRYTEAAHEAGFSDSAHLSRTFKSLYGLTLSDLYRTIDRNRIRYCP